MANTLHQLQLFGFASTGIPVEAHGKLIAEIVADAFGHPWIAFGCGFVSALILVVIVGVIFVGLSANADGRHW